MRKIMFILLALVLAVGLVVPAACPVLAAGPMPGAIFTTDNTCTGVNLNIYGNRTDVYLDGGPAHLGAAGLLDGDYYVQVTEPNGTLLGNSSASSTPTPVHVTDGEFEHCYQLWAILVKDRKSTRLNSSHG